MIDNSVLKKIKLVVLDVDGTLVNEHGEIGEKTKELVEKLKKMDVAFTLASGRLHSSLKYYSRELNLKKPVISLDGALIKAVDSDTTIFEKYVPEKKIKKILSYSDRFLTLIALCKHDRIVFTEHNEIITRFVDKFGTDTLLIDDYFDNLSQCLEVLLVSEIKDVLNTIAEKLNFPFSLGLSTNIYKSHSNTGYYCLEVRKSGVSKAIGLKKLIRHLKVKIDETVVMGDWYNDKPLFETKAIKVAPANAVSEIKFLANYVTKNSNNEDAVGEFLELIYNAKKK